mgnify:CR=1 FL=1
MLKDDDIKGTGAQRTRSVRYVLYNTVRRCWPPGMFSTMGEW